MDQETIRAELAATVALWSVGYLDGAAVVRVACDALVVGVDGPALRMLAAVPYRSAVDEVPEVLPAAMRELGLAYHPRPAEEPQALMAALRVLCARVLAGTLPPRNLAYWAHERFGHDGPALVEPLVVLDDVYDCLPSADQTAAEVDDEVRAAARRILEESEQPGR